MRLVFIISFTASMAFMGLQSLAQGKATIGEHNYRLEQAIEEVSR